MADMINPALAGGQGMVIETGEMTIKGHLLKLPDIVIQISNISGITVSEVVIPNPGMLLILLGGCLCVIGPFLMKASEHYSYYSGTYHDDNILAAGMIALIIGVALLFWGISMRGGKTSNKYLNIYLNSGMRYSISFKKDAFLMEVLGVFSNIFEEGGTASTVYKISIQDSKFIGSSVVNN